jgi:large subunit ribosomal protein L19
LDAVQKISSAQMGDKKYDFAVGDTVEVSSKVVEGDKERIQVFRGLVIKLRGEKNNRSFTVRKISQGIGVEKIFPLYSPIITEVKTVRGGKVRRAKLYYLRKRKGKRATSVKTKS